MPAMTFKIGFAHERQLKEFIKLLRAMQFCGNIGHSTSFNVGVDGDGAFSMDVEVIDENGKLTNLRELVNLDDKSYWEAVKDHRKWFPNSKDELDFGFE